MGKKCWLILLLFSLENLKADAQVHQMHSLSSQLPQWQLYQLFYHHRVCFASSPVSDSNLLAVFQPLQTMSQLSVSLPRVQSLGPCCLWVSTMETPQCLCRIFWISQGPIREGELMWMFEQGFTKHLNLTPLWEVLMMWRSRRGVKGSKKYTPSNFLGASVQMLKLESRGPGEDSGDCAWWYPWVGPPCTATTSVVLWPCVWLWARDYCWSPAPVV